MKESFIKIKHLVFIILFLFISNNIYSQKDTSFLQVSKFWTHIGIGPSSLTNCFSGNVALQKNKYLFSLSFIYNWEQEKHELFGGQWFSPKSLLPEKVWAIGPLVGLTKNAKHGFASISSGVTFVGGIKRGDYVFLSYNEIPIRTVGIPFDVQFFYRFPPIGIGIDLNANINNRRSFAGIMFCLQFGATF
jgi:hypothetical protein